MSLNNKLPVTAFFIVVIFIVMYSLGRPVVKDVKAESYLWGVRSIDTMKTSRDLALTELNNPSYETNIQKQLALIKDLGANYVAIDTPYDSQFHSFLVTWVNLARKEGLSVWFRGSFSNYEGWFNYPKNLSPDALLAKTENFISANPDLFKDNDIFDPCPECENAGFWPQNEGNSAYNEFMKKKNDVLKLAFQKINKDVIYNWNSVIGGRAKDVLTKDTFSRLGNVIAIDHYVNTPGNYGDYINYFADNFQTKTVVSEFGAPIPNIHGKMNDEKQADFINRIMLQFYKNKNNVLGINYWVLSMGTTALYENDLTPKPAALIIKNYYRPAIIRGVIKNTLGDNLKNIKVATSDGLNTVYTDTLGNYQLVIPANTPLNFTVGSDSYESQSLSENTKLSFDETRIQNFTLTPKNQDIIYFIRLHLNSIFQ